MERTKEMKNISILGSTGSIGRNTLQVISNNPDRFRAVALAAGTNVELLAKQVEEFKPKIVSVGSKQLAGQLKTDFNVSGVKIVWGEEGLAEVACWHEAQMVLSAVVGAAGLVPTWRAIEAGKDIALANKETLVTAGALFMEKVARENIRLIPVDSEHSAIFQSLEGNNRSELAHILLTASGGPFRGWKTPALTEVTPKMALAHPNWNMGAKISIDSATLMNKGLEVIEARWLFDAPSEIIEVVVHPESIVHSMVEFIDGQVIAQLGVPDMKGPIAYALSYPERMGDVLKRLDLKSLESLHFYEADTDVFRCLKLAFDALAGPDSMPTVLNAANEVAVAAFLEKRIGFLDIPKTIEYLLETSDHSQLSDLEHVVAVDAEARRLAQQFIDGLRS